MPSKNFTQEADAESYFTTATEAPKNNIKRNMKKVDLDG